MEVRVPREIELEQSTRGSALVSSSSNNGRNDWVNQRCQACIRHNLNGKKVRVCGIYPSGREYARLKPYEWQVFMMNRWQPYRRSIGLKLEKLFWNTRRDREILRRKFRRNWWHVGSPAEMLTIKYTHYKICPLFMLQRNLKTGKEREIRRMKIERNSTPVAVQKVSPPCRVQYSHPSPEHYKMHFGGKDKNPSRGDMQGRRKKVRSHAYSKSRIYSAGSKSHQGRVRHYRNVESSSSIASCNSYEVPHKYQVAIRWSTEEAVKLLRIINLEKYSRIF
jgi:hypothetical protein